MKEIWVEIDPNLPEEAKLKLLKACEGKCQAAIVEEKLIDEAKKLNVKPASEKHGEIIVFGEEAQPKAIAEAKSKGKTVCLKVRVERREDEDKIVDAASRGIDYILVSCPDWKIIPLENLIAKVRGKAKLLAEVSSAEEARVAAETLELGVDGVVLKARKPNEIEETVSKLREIEGARIELSRAKVVNVTPIGSGLRACIDTCDLLSPDEGMLVGCQSSGLFLVRAEVEENPFVEPRPFRVNAGPISLYILAKDGRTKYLSELKAGDEVSIVSRDGSLRTAVVGRVKIERRPMLLIEAEINGKTVKTIVQNAETIRLITPDGSKSVCELKPGDEVLVHYAPGGRHFGILVKEETVIER